MSRGIRFRFFVYNAAQRTNKAISRRPTVRSATTLLACDFDANSQWKSEWEQNFQSGLI